MVVILLNLGDCVSNMCQKYLLIIPLGTRCIFVCQKQALDVSFEGRNFKIYFKNFWNFSFHVLKFEWTIKPSNPSALCTSL